MDTGKDQPVSIATINKAAHPIEMWTDPATVESQAFDQLINIANLPWIHKHVAVMPDVHYGKGATVGSVIAMRDAVAPSAVGVDIGCGMAAVKTNLTASDLPEDLLAIRLGIERAIPVGFSRHTFVVNGAAMHGFNDLTVDLSDRASRVACQIGTLGGGNHFIELCVDDAGCVWMMLHSGSRNAGKEIAERHISVAKTLEHNAKLPDPDLAVFLAGTDEMRAYRHDLTWAQNYAATNRATMLRLYSNVMREHFPHVEFAFTINAHHNYVAEEHHFGADVLVTRKGAISAKAGEWGIIPGSMGTGSYIVKGLGNPDSFTSASHGAGRRMSRSKAKKQYTVADVEAQTFGVECRKDKGIIDEIPAAYKDIDVVINQQADLVSVHAHLTAVLCVKG